MSEIHIFPGIGYLHSLRLFFHEILKITKGKSELTLKSTGILHLYQGTKAAASVPGQLQVNAPNRLRENSVSSVILLPRVHKLNFAMTRHQKNPN